MSIKTPTRPVSFPTVRMRRLRQQTTLRRMVREHTLSVDDLICPLFIKAGLSEKVAIASMPGYFQLTLDDLDQEIHTLRDLRIPAVLLFGIPAAKDDIGRAALNPDGIVQLAAKRIKDIAPEILVIADVCLCEYTDHGHCGVVDDAGFASRDVNNDKTLPLLAEQAVSLARAGCDVIAPSGSMDGMVLAIREGLDKAGYSHIPILSYAVKYASSFYGPFRAAAEGAPTFGDRRTYQMDPANASRSLREARMDVQEGADLLMVKPAMPYLDIIYRVKQEHPGVPMVAYQVSGEYAMLKAAADKGWLYGKNCMLESLISIKRAGADMIITYFAKEVAAVL